MSELNPQVPIDVSLDDIVYGLANQGCAVVENAILQLDLTQQDADFTMDVITKLAISLRKDLGYEDMKEFLKDLRKKLK
jgi:hypothetical protein